MLWHFKPLAFYLACFCVCMHILVLVSYMFFILIIFQADYVFIFFFLFCLPSILHIFCCILVVWVFLTVWYCSLTCFSFRVAGCFDYCHFCFSCGGIADLTNVYNCLLLRLCLYIFYLYIFALFAPAVRFKLYNVSLFPSFFDEFLWEDL